MFEPFEDLMDFGTEDLIGAENKGVSLGFEEYDRLFGDDGCDIAWEPFPAQQDFRQESRAKQTKHIKDIFPETKESIRRNAVQKWKAKRARVPKVGTIAKVRSWNRKGVTAEFKRSAKGVFEKKNTGFVSVTELKDWTSVVMPIPKPEIKIRQEFVSITKLQNPKPKAFVSITELQNSKSQDFVSVAETNVNRKPKDFVSITLLQKSC